MASRSAAGLVGLLAAVLLAGCKGRPPAPPRVDTGAEAAARAYFDALVRQDWAAAYLKLHPDSKALCDVPSFFELAEGYHRGLGFTPEAVTVRSCEERGDEALAHVVLMGHAGGKGRRYRDATALRRRGSDWRVVLPPRFGRPRR